jgi:hypothetical protein
LCGATLGLSGKRIRKWDDHHYRAVLLPDAYLPNRGVAYEEVREVLEKVVNGNDCLLARSRKISKDFALGSSFSGLFTREEIGHTPSTDLLRLNKSAPALLS